MGTDLTAENIPNLPDITTSQTSLFFPVTGGVDAIGGPLMGWLFGVFCTTGGFRRTPGVPGRPHQPLGGARRHQLRPDRLHHGPEALCVHPLLRLHPLGPQRYPQGHIPHPQYAGLPAPTVDHLHHIHSSGGSKHQSVFEGLDIFATPNIFEAFSRICIYACGLKHNLEVRLRIQSKHTIQIVRPCFYRSTGVAMVFRTHGQ